jgi:hypothetical protein
MDDPVILFAFFGFPLSVAALGWIGLLLHERAGRRQNERRERQSAASFARLAATNQANSDARDDDLGRLNRQG